MSYSFSKQMFCVNIIVAADADLLWYQVEVLSASVMEIKRYTVLFWVNSSFRISKRLTLAAQPQNFTLQVYYSY